MIYSEPARTTRGRIWIRWIGMAGLLAVTAAIGAAAGHRWPATSSSTAPAHVHRRDHRGAPGAPDGLPPVPDQGGPLGEADGAVPDGTTVFSEDIPGVTKLAPALLAALRRAATEAGVPFLVDSGWRSAAYQRRLFRQAVDKYGSEAEAARWVARPHVSGDAVDLAPDAAGWLRAHGAADGLCQVYANEPWHFELRPQAVSQGCPAMYADPTHDPRMQR